MGEMIGDERFRTEVAQNAEELAWFLDLIERERVGSYLEIGARYGGSFWRIAAALPLGAKMVAVDYPNSMGGRDDSRASLVACVTALNARDFRARVILGDSTDPAVVAQVRRLAPYDLVFIDANHGLSYVMQDWVNYGQMSAKLVAFHDINWSRPPEYPGKKTIEVPILWNALREKYRVVECKRERRNNGIGVLWIA
jgi:predicted O-methyltransferase YrrM